MVLLPAGSLRSVEEDSGVSFFQTGPSISHLSPGTQGHQVGFHPIKCRRILIKSYLNEF